MSRLAIEQVLQVAAPARPAAEPVQPTASDRPAFQEHLERASSETLPQKSTDPARETVAETDDDLTSTAQQQDTSASPQDETSIAAETAVADVEEETDSKEEAEQDEVELSEAVTALADAQTSTDNEAALTAEQALLIGKTSENSDADSEGQNHEPIATDSEASADESESAEKPATQPKTKVETPSTDLPEQKSESQETSDKPAEDIEIDVNVVSKDEPEEVVQAKIDPSADSQQKDVQPEKSQPENVQLKDAQPEVVRSDNAQLEEVQPEVVKSEVVQPKQVQAVQVQVEEAQPEEVLPKVDSKDSNEQTSEHTVDVRRKSKTADGSVQAAHGKQSTAEEKAVEQPQQAGAKTEVLESPVDQKVVRQDSNPQPSKAESQTVQNEQNALAAENQPGVLAKAPGSETVSAPSVLPVHSGGEDASVSLRASGAPSALSSEARPDSEATPTVDRARFVRRVGGAIRSAQSRDGKIQLQLSPPELGSLRIEITMKQGVLTAQLETETSTARNVLLDNLPALRERLAEQDIRIEKFDVDVRDEGRQQQEGPSAKEREANRSQAEQKRSSNTSSQQKTIHSAATSGNTGPVATFDGGLDVRV